MLDGVEAVVAAESVRGAVEIASSAAGHGTDLGARRPAVFGLVVGGEHLELGDRIQVEAEERAVVAGVYYNRLQDNMALDADPSVIYAELLQGTYGGALHHDDMRFNSLYNTYVHAGLPPGPIANPGKSSLQATMHPATTSFYYFVSDGNGHHRFSSTFEEHNKNVAALRHVMSQK